MKLSRVPAYPFGEERTYALYLTGAVRRWRSALLPLIRDALTAYRDSWLSDLTSRARSLWQEQVQNVRRQAEQVFGRVDTAHRRWWEKLTQAPHRLPLERDELDDRLAVNVRLIQNIGDTAAHRIEEIIRDGARSGLSLQSIEALIRPVLDATEGQARRIARDQIGKHFGVVNELRQRQAGIEWYIWRTVGDDKVRQKHADREGQLFNWNNPPQGGHPGQEINCRCVAEPYLGAAPFDWVFIHAQGFISPEDRRLLRRIERIENQAEFERAIAQLKTVEVMACFDSSGKKIFQTVGQPDTVALTESQSRRARNAVLVHNHPNGSGFSDADLGSAIYLNAREIRAVGYFRGDYYEFSARKPRSMANWLEGSKTITDVPDGQIETIRADAQSTQKLIEQLRYSPIAENIWRPRFRNAIGFAKIEDIDRLKLAHDASRFQAKAICEVLHVQYKEGVRRNRR